MTPLLIFGAGVQAQVVVDLVAWELADRYRIAGFLDDRIPAGTPGPGGAPVLGPLAEGLELARSHNAAFFLAMGTRAGGRKLALFRQLTEAGLVPASLISPRAVISPSASVGVHALVLPGVFLGAQVRVGDLFTAHAGAVVEHHGELGDHVLLGPNATLAGGARVGSHAFVGAGACVSAGVRVGDGCLVGCGAVVVRDIPDWHVAVGVPARELRMTHAGDEVPLRHDVESIR